MTEGTIETPQAAKARGAFYTPRELTRFLAQWAIRSPGDRVLEPAAGDGAFANAVSERLGDLGAGDPTGRLVAVEREPAEAAKVVALNLGAEVLVTDFFDLEPAATGPFHAVVGNPPYIRYHGFRGSEREKALVRARAQGVELTRLASSWAHFVVHATAFLGRSGRLGLVLPAELLHTEYGQPVRDFLLRRFGSVIVLAFDRALFAGAQVDAVLLLASNDDERGLRIVRLPDDRALETIDVAAYGEIATLAPPGRWSGSVDRDAGAVYANLVDSRVAIPLGALASVDIGFVSGANDFFVLSPADAEKRGLPRRLLTPTLRRPGDVPGLLASGGEVRLLLDLAGCPEIDDVSLLEYLAEGEATGIADRYKCRVRRPWYAVPLPRTKPDAFLPYMSHFGPRIIVNDVDAWSSNLLHGVFLGLLAPPARALAAAVASSLTLLSAEIEGRSYGGGVLKLETKEAERLLVPVLSQEQAKELESEFPDVDRLVTARKIEEAASVVDERLGLDHDALWRAYLTFRRRRLGRRRANAA